MVAQPGRAGSRRQEQEAGEQLRSAWFVLVGVISWIVCSGFAAIRSTKSHQLHERTGNRTFVKAVGANMETLEAKIKRVLADEVGIAPYDPAWPQMFEDEKTHLLACLPRELIGRIEHFGSTAVPQLASKPIIDMLVEVTSLDETRKRI